LSQSAQHQEDTVFSSITADVAKTHRDDLLATAARYRSDTRPHRNGRRFRRQWHRHLGR
jgi:hypothetical protein